MSEKTTSYEQMMFADYPDIVGICDLQKMLGIGRKAALDLAKHPQIHGVIVSQVHGSLLRTYSHTSLTASQGVTRSIAANCGFRK